MSVRSIVDKSKLSALLKRAVLHDWGNFLYGMDTEDEVQIHVNDLESGHRHWWALDAAGNPIDQATLGDRPEGSYPANRDPYTPYCHVASHLHGKNGANGIHVLGTLEQARAELYKARNGESKLPWGTGVI
jgi:hypothetical protein